MFNRFIDIVNDLAHQGKTFANGDKMNKLLRALPKESNNVKTSVRETTRIQAITLEEIIGTFTSYEVEQQIEEGISKGKKAIAFKVNPMMQVIHCQLKMKMMMKTWHYSLERSTAL